MSFASMGLGDEPAVDELQFRRVLVPQEDLPLLGSEFVPIDIEELAELMRAVNSRDLQPAEDIPSPLVQGRYVASLIGNDLVSDASRLALQHVGPSETEVSIAPFSLALKRSSVPRDALDRHQREGWEIAQDGLLSDLEGRPSIRLSQSIDYWFGWNTRGTPSSDASRLTFAFDYPRALDNRLYLRLPAMWRVAESSTIARPLPDPASELGSGWPGIADLSSSLDNWWTIELSSATHVSFVLVHGVERQALPYEHAVPREHSEYVLQPGGLEVKTSYEIDRDREQFIPWTIGVDDGLHVESVMLDDRELSWRPHVERQTMEVVIPPTPDQSSGRRSRLIVQGVAEWPLKVPSQALPAFHLRDAYTIDGSGSLGIHPQWVVEHLAIHGGKIVARSGTAQLGGLGRWDFAWTGQHPALTLRASPRRTRSMVDVFSRLTNEVDGLVATSWVQIGASTQLRPSYRFRLSPGWQIESIQPTERRYLVSYRPVVEGDATLWEIQVTPAVVDQALGLEIRARFPWNTSTSSAIDSPVATTQTFRGERPIAFEESHQSDLYWIEPIGRYKLEANSELLQHRIDEDELSESHRQRLPRIGDVWILRTQNGGIPSLTFQRQTAPYTIQLQSTIVPGLLGVTTEHHVRCVPVAGTVGSVMIEVADKKEGDLTWRQKVEDADNGERWIPLESRRIDPATARNETGVTSAGRFYRVELSTPVSDEVELVGVSGLTVPKAKDELSGTVHVALPSFPEAAQQDAMLHVDQRLKVVPWNDGSQLTPSGYHLRQDGHVALQFRYDPIRVNGVDLQIKTKTDASPSWLSDARTMFCLYADGRTQIEFEAMVHANGNTSIDLELPDGWSFRSGQVGDEVVIAELDGSLSRRLRVWIARHVGLSTAEPFTLKLAGPPWKLADHLPIDLPRLNFSVPLTSNRYEVWLPPTMSVAPRGDRLFLSFPKLLDGRLLPQNWYRSLSTVETLSPPGEALASPRFSSPATTDQDDSSTKLRLSWLTRCAGEEKVSQSPILLRMTESVRAERWMTVFAGFVLSLCFGSLRKRFLLFGIVILMGGIMIASERSLPSMQQIMLGWLLGSVIHWMAYCSRFRLPHSDSSGEGLSHGSRTHASILSQGGHDPSATRPAIPFRLGLWLGWMIGLALVAWGTMEGNVWGEDKGQSERFNSSTPSMAEDREKTYHIVLPINRDGESSGRIAYISDELFRRLHQSKTNRQEKSYLRSIEYEMRLPDPSFRGGNDQARLVARIELEVRDLNTVITWPLRAQAGSFVSMRVDGDELSLGSRLRLDEDAIHWSPSKAGTARIELTLAPVVHNQDGKYACHVDVLPCVQARMLLEAENALDVGIFSLGQITNPRMGRYEVELGGVPAIDVEWRGQERELRQSASPPQLVTQLVLNDSAILARTELLFEQIDLDEDRFDVECDSSWQPIGRDWGDALLMDIGAINPSNRRRYRLHWKDHQQARPAMRSIITHWTIGDSRQQVFPLPILEPSGTRLGSSQLEWIRTPRSVWSMEGLQAEASLEPNRRFDWFPRPELTVASYRRQSSDNNIVLRRSPAPVQPWVVAESRIRVSRNQVTCRSVFAFGDDEARGPYLELRIPRAAEVRTLRINDVEVPFSVEDAANVPIIGEQGPNSAKPGQSDAPTPIVAHRESTVQAFLDPNASHVESLSIELAQGIDDQQSTSLPLPELVGVGIASHRILASRTVDQWIEWEGTEGLTFEQSPVVPKADWRLPNESTQELEVDEWVLNLQREPWERGGSPVTSGQALRSDALDAAPGNPSTALIPDLRFRLRSSQQKGTGEVVTRLERLEDRWQFSIRGRIVGGEAPTDGVLMEIPSAIAENLLSSHRIAKLASPEVGRQLVYLLFGPTPKGSPVEFSLTSTTSTIETDSMVAVPEIRMMGDVNWQRRIIVPRSIQGRQVVWDWTGARLEDHGDLTSFFGDEWKEIAQTTRLIIPTTDRPRVRLSNNANDLSPLILRLTHHEAMVDSDHMIKVVSTFIVSPHGHKAVQLRLPAKMQLVAVESNGRMLPPGAFDLESIDASDATKPPSDTPVGTLWKRLGLRLQSSSLPQSLTVHGNIPLDEFARGQDFSQAAWPTLLGITSEETLVRLTTTAGWNPATITSLTSAEFVKSRLEGYLSMVDDATVLIAEVPLSERVQWWQDWEKATSRAWQEAVDSADQDWIDEGLERRRTFMQRFQLPTVGSTENFKPIKRLPSASSRNTPIEVAEKVGYYRLATHQPTDEGLPREHQNGSRAATFIPWRNALATLGWLVFLTLSLAMTQEFARYWGWYLQAFLQDRPWWLWSVLGIVTFAFFPWSFAGPAVIGLAMYLVLRGRNYYRRQVSGARS